MTEHPLTRLAQGAAASAAELAQALDPMRAAICPHVRWWTRDLTRAENITLLGPMCVLISSTSACLTGIAGAAAAQAGPGPAAARDLIEAARLLQLPLIGVEHAMTAAGFTGYRTPRPTASADTARAPSKHRTTGRTQIMNEYGAMAREHCRRWRPAAFAAITDPDSYFTDLGERVAQEISDLWAQLRDKDGNPPGEEYLARVGRLNALRKQAEEVVLADLVLLPPEPQAGRDDG